MLDLEAIKARQMEARGYCLGPTLAVVVWDDVPGLVQEIERLTGGILAALDNLDGGPEAIETAESALRRALRGE